MSLSNIVKVNELKDSLVKQLENGIEDERCIDVLNQLQSCSIDLNVLSETLVGTVVSRLKRNENAKISTIAKGLVKEWKNIAKQRCSLRKSAVSKIAQKSIKVKPHNSGSNCRAEKCTVHNSQMESCFNLPIEISITDICAEWDNLPPLRKNCLKKLYSTFVLSATSMTESGIHANTFKSLCVSRSSQVEEVIHTLSRCKNTPYTNKVRSLVFNMKKNTILRENVLIGSTTPSKLVMMSSNQLATDKIAKERSKLVENLQDSRRLDWEQANESRINEMCGIKGDLLKASLFTCGRCKSHKTTSTQKQTRSADEPITVFVLCLDCSNRWKC